MKDMLGRDICLGDTLAYIDNPYCSPSYPHARTLNTAKVSDMAVFALQLTPPATADAEEAKPFIISDASQYVICDWAK